MLPDALGHHDMPLARRKIARGREDEICFSFNPCPRLSHVLLFPFPTEPRLSGCQGPGRQGHTSPGGGGEIAVVHSTKWKTENTPRVTTEPPGPQGRSAWLEPGSRNGARSGLAVGPGRKGPLMEGVIGPVTHSWRSRARELPCGVHDVDVCGEAKAQRCTGP